MQLTERRITALTFAGLVVVWHVIAFLAGRTEVSGQRFVPTLWEIAEAFPTIGYYWQGGLGVPPPTDTPTPLAALLALLYHSLVTTLRLVVGLSIGTTIALLAAALIAWSPVLQRMFAVPANAARMLPLIAMAPLFGVWFGARETGAILFIAFACFAIVFIVALTAIGNVPPWYQQYARTMGAGRVRAYAVGALAGAMPAIRGGVVLALGFGWSMVIAAEFIGQDTGLGNIVNRAQEFGRTDTLAVVGLFVVVYAYLSYRLADRLLDRMTRWAE